MYLTYDNALRENFNFAITTFAGSVILAVASFWILRYLPDPIQSEKEKLKEKVDK
ncbi:hypothetical protein GCM10009122_23680 [Fulvivirga kasyanovii]|uniref:hypothetical protein n=1 Tax=Fulvivirga kasyanovii TaxID=396812 RepID=UPI0012BCE23B|nr:hypothetical protein [Fulvivirga kasyanovii]